MSGSVDALIDALEATYEAFEARVLPKHRDCSFGTHARNCHEEAFRAGWLASPGFASLREANVRRCVDAYHPLEKWTPVVRGRGVSISG